MSVQCVKCAYGLYCLSNPMENGDYILEDVSFSIDIPIQNRL